MKWPKISIVTPSFNQGQYLEQTIQSVVNQDYPNFEYIIIDGGSTDNTTDVIKKYQKKISYWISESDNGQSHAINKGIQKCSGEIVTWLNSDDQYFSNSVLREVAKFFLENKCLDVCYGNNVYIDAGSRLLYVRKGIPYFSKRLLRVWNYIHQPTVFLRRRVVEEFKIDESLHYVMDYEYWIRISQTYKFGYINVLISASRWHAQCKTIGRASEFSSELNIIQSPVKPRGKGLLLRSQYLRRTLYILQRVYSLPYLLQLSKQQCDICIDMKKWRERIKRQIFGAGLTS